MAEVIKGLGVVWGANLFSAVAATPNTTYGTATGKVQSVSYEHNSEKVEVKGDDGEVQAVIFFNTTEKITVDVIPIGATIAAAVTNNVLPTIGSNVTITDTADSEFNAAVFIYDGGSKRRTVDGAAVLTMNLVRYNQATLADPAAS